MEPCVLGMAQSQRGDSFRTKYKRSRRIGEGQGRHHEVGSLYCTFELGFFQFCMYIGVRVGT